MIEQDFIPLSPFAQRSSEMSMPVSLTYSFNMKSSCRKCITFLSLFQVLNSPSSGQLLKLLCMAASPSNQTSGHLVYYWLNWWPRAEYHTQVSRGAAHTSVTLDCVFFKVSILEKQSDSFSVNQTCYSDSPSSEDFNSIFSHMQIGNRTAFSWRESSQMSSDLSEHGKAPLTLSYMISLSLSSVASSLPPAVREQYCCQRVSGGTVGVALITERAIWQTKPPSLVEDHLAPVASWFWCKLLGLINSPQCCRVWGLNPSFSFFVTEVWLTRRFWLCSCSAEGFIFTPLLGSVELCGSGIPRAKCLHRSTSSSISACVCINRDTVKWQACY